MKKLIQTIGLSFLLCFMSTSAFSDGLDINTKLLLHFEEPVSGVTAHGGKEILDASGNHVVTQVDDAQLTTANKKFGSSGLILDGVNDGISIPNSTDWLYGGGTGDFTIEGWYNIQSSATIALWGNASFGQQSYMYSSSAGTEIRVIFENTGGTDILHFSVPFIRSTHLNKWTHLALARNCSDNDIGCWDVFVNGVPQTLTLLAGAWNGTLVDLNNAFFIGEYYQGQTGDFEGTIEEFRISTVDRYGAGTDFSSSLQTEAFTSDANTSLLLHFDTQDVSGDGGSDSYHIPDFQGDAQIDTAVAKFDAGALILDGTGDYVGFSDSPSWDIMSDVSSSNTIDFWINFANHAGQEHIIAQSNSDGTEYWKIHHVDGYGFQFFAKNIASGSIVNLPYGGEITDTNWHHIALVIIGDTSTNTYGIYVDGIQVNYLQESAIYDYAELLYIGTIFSSGSPIEFFDGNMDEIRIQKSNYFNANPNVVLTDTITVPTEAYSIAVVGGRRIFRITKVIPLKNGNGYDRVVENHWYTHKDI